MEYLGYVIIGFVAFVLGIVTGILAFHIKRMRKEQNGK